MVKRVEATYVKKSDEVVAYCPFCGKNNVENRCEHFLSVWRSPYKNMSGNKLSPDIYTFQQNTD